MRRIVHDVRLTLVLCALLTTTILGCAANAPPSLSPVGVTIWQANEAVVALGTVQHTAIELNKLQVCDPMPCHPLLSDRNTGVVVDAVASALTTIQRVPGGWKPTALAALQQMTQRLDAAGKAKLAAYVQAALTVVNAL